MLKFFLILSLLKDCNFPFFRHSVLTTPAGSIQHRRRRRWSDPASLDGQLLGSDSHSLIVYSFIPSKRGMARESILFGNSSYINYSYSLELDLNQIHSKPLFHIAVSAAGRASTTSASRTPPTRPRTPGRRLQSSQKARFGSEY